MKKTRTPVRTEEDYTSIVKNLHDAYNRTSVLDKVEGKVWYTTAHQWCQDISVEYSQPLDVIIGITAVLSPVMAWDLNKTMVIRILQGDEIKWRIPLNIVKARKILESGKVFPTLRGVKVTSFYNAIKFANSPDFVVIDRWALRTAYNDYSLEAVGDEEKYWFIASAFREVASEYGYLPLEFQAILWVWARREYPQ